MAARVAARAADASDGELRKRVAAALEALTKEDVDVAAAPTATARAIDKEVAAAARRAAPLGGYLKEDDGPDARARRFGRWLEMAVEALGGCAARGAASGEFNGDVFDAPRPFGGIADGNDPASSPGAAPSTNAESSPATVAALAAFCRNRPGLESHAKALDERHADLAAGDVARVVLDALDPAELRKAVQRAAASATPSHAPYVDAATSAVERAATRVAAASGDGFSAKKDEAAASKRGAALHAPAARAAPRGGGVALDVERLFAATSEPTEDAPTDVSTARGLAAALLKRFGDALGEAVRALVLDAPAYAQLERDARRLHGVLAWYLDDADHVRDCELRVARFLQAASERVAPA